MKVITQEKEKKQTLALNPSEARILACVLSAPIWGGGNVARCHSLTVKYDLNQLIEVVVEEEEKVK